MDMPALPESIGMVFPIRIRATMNRRSDMMIAGMENDSASHFARFVGRVTSCAPFLGRLLSLSRRDKRQ